MSASSASSSIPTSFSQKKKRTKSSKAHLAFPVSRIINHLKQGHYSYRIGTGAGVYMAAVLQYLTSEILELAGLVCVDNKRKRINPRDIHLGIGNDVELSSLLRDVVISQGGIIPHIEPILLPTPSGKLKIQQLPLQRISEQDEDSVNNDFDDVSDEVVFRKNPIY